MSEETQSETTGTAAPAADSAAAEEPKLRRRPLGYRKRDVLEALDRRSAALEARDAELAELRQDIAALWLAFAQHDRMIRTALGEEVDTAPARPGPEPEAGRADARPSGPAAAPAAQVDDAAIGRQLSDLDEVLSAIELATRTLEQTYVEDAERPGATSSADPGHPAEDES